MLKLKKLVLASLALGTLAIVTASKNEKPEGRYFSSQKVVSQHSEGDDTITTLEVTKWDSEHPNSGELGKQRITLREPRPKTGGFLNSDGYHRQESISTFPEYSSDSVPSLSEDRNIDPDFEVDYDYLAAEHGSRVSLYRHGKLNPSSRYKRSRMFNKYNQGQTTTEVNHYNEGGQLVHRWNRDVKAAELEEEDQLDAHVAPNDEHIDQVRARTVESPALSVDTGGRSSTTARLRKGLSKLFKIEQGGHYEDLYDDIGGRKLTSVSTRHSAI